MIGRRPQSLSFGYTKGSALLESPAEMNPKTGLNRPNSLESTTFGAIFLNCQKIVRQSPPRPHDAQTVSLLPM
jgi:hypothetical protein